MAKEGRPPTTPPPNSSPQLRRLLGDGARRCREVLAERQGEMAGGTVGRRRWDLGWGCRCDSRSHLRDIIPTVSWAVHQIGGESVWIADATVRCIGGTRSRLRVRRCNVQVGVDLDCGCEGTVYELDVVWIEAATVQRIGATWSRLQCNSMTCRCNVVQIAGVAV